MKIIKYCILIGVVFVNSYLFSGTCASLDRCDYFELRNSLIGLAGATAIWINLSSYGVDIVLNPSPKPSFRRSIMKIVQVSASVCAAVGILHGRYSKRYALATISLYSAGLITSLYDSFEPKSSEDKK